MANEHLKSSPHILHYLSYLLFVRATAWKKAFFKCHSKHAQLSGTESMTCIQTNFNIYLINFKIHLLLATRSCVFPTLILFRDHGTDKKIAEIYVAAQRALYEMLRTRMRKCANVYSYQRK
jgi:hypothetical protein